MINEIYQGRPVVSLRAYQLWQRPYSAQSYIFCHRLPDAYRYILHTYVYIFFYNVLLPKFHPIVHLVIIMMSGTRTRKNSCTAVEKDETDKPGAKDERRTVF